jgi:cell division FtsZ-interacting protein ZapD
MIFEFPTHDVSRFCLRLEKLSGQVALLREQGLMHMAIEHQVELLQLIDRPDIRTKFVKVLHVFLQRYQEFIKEEHVDQVFLQDLIARIKYALNFLQNDARSVVQDIHDSAFTSQLMQGFSSPARLCEFSHPVLVMVKQFREVKWLPGWFGLTAPFENIAQLLLEIFRMDIEEYALMAHGGHCNLELPSQHEVMLLQIEIDEPVFPLISYGRGRISLHFQQLANKPHQQLGLPVKRSMEVRVKMSQLSKSTL